MLGSGSLENHLILPPCNKTLPSVDRFIKTIYGKLFNMSLEFDGMRPFQRAHRVQSVQRLEPHPRSLFVVSSSSTSVHILGIGQRDKNTSQGQHWLQS